VSSATLGPSSIRHIFVSLRGIEAHPSALAEADLSDWQELAARLRQQPVQVDLMAPMDDSRRPNLFGEAIVPAGAYRQIRLRLLPNHPAEDEPTPAENACGGDTLNCIVTSDGRIRALALDGASPELRIAPERIAGGSFLVFPGVVTGLVIEFDPYLSSALPTGDAVRFVPVFTVTVQRLPEEFQP